MIGEFAMKTKEELNALKEEAEALNKKPHELTKEELAQVTGGVEIRDSDGEHVIEPAGYEAEGDRE